MASTALALSLALLALSGARACSLPRLHCLQLQLPGRQQLWEGAAYFNGRNNTANKLIGMYYGLWNEAAGPRARTPSQFGGPIINFEVVKVDLPLQPLVNREAPQRGEFHALSSSFPCSLLGPVHSSSSRVRL